MEIQKKKIPGIYLAVIAAICFLTFFFTSISTILSWYIGYRTNGSSLQNKVVGNIDNYINEINNHTVLINIDRYTSDEYKKYYLNVFYPENKSFNQVQMSEYIEGLNHTKPYIIGADKNNIWIYNDGIFAYNVNSLKQEYSVLDIYKKSPFIEKVMTNPDVKYQFKEDKIIINDNNAFYSLDTNDLSVKIEKDNSGKISETQTLADTSNNQSIPLISSKDEVRLIGNLEKKIYLRKLSKHGKIDQKVKTNLSFKNGKILMDTTNNRIIESNNPESIVIIHEDKMSNQGKHFTISNVSLKGILQWVMFQSDIGLTPLNQSITTIDKAYLNSKNQLIMITKNPEAVFAFDMKNGSILWKY